MSATNPSRRVTGPAASPGFALLGQAGPGAEGRLPADNIKTTTAAITAIATAETARSVRLFTKIPSFPCIQVTNGQVSTLNDGCHHIIR